MLIEEKDGKIEGFCCIMFYPEPWTGELVCSEMCWYSEGREGLKLMRFAQQLAKKCGAKIMYGQHLNTRDSARVAKFYEKVGFALSYFRYSKEL